MTNVFSDISVTLSLTPCVRGLFILFDSLVSPTLLSHPSSSWPLTLFFMLKQEANLIKFSGVLMTNRGERVRRTHSVSELWKSHGHLDGESLWQWESGHPSLSQTHTEVRETSLDTCIIFTDCGSTRWAKLYQYWSFTVTWKGKCVRNTACHWSNFPSSFPLLYTHTILPENAYAHF